MDSADCGPACLRMVAAYWGKKYSLQQLRNMCHITREGVSLLGISDAAESIGLRSLGVKITWKQLSKEASLPCIVYWNQEHFVVIVRIVKHFGPERICVADPAEGLLTYSKEGFLNGWISDKGKDAGIALLLSPTPAFYEKEANEGPRYNLRKIVQYLLPYYGYMGQILLAMAVSSILSLLLPFITQAVVDVGIGSANLSFVVLLLLAQLLLTMGQLANDLIRSWLMLHTTSRISVSLISDFLAKLMRLPIAFFDNKKVGDILQRIGDYDRIQTFLTRSLLSIVIAVVSVVVYSCIMAVYDARVFAVFVVGSILYIGWILIFMKRRRKLDYMRFQQSSSNQSNIIQLVGGMQEIKLNNCEKQKRWDWEHIQARLFKVNVLGLSLEQTQEIGSEFIDQVKNILISFLAAKGVIDGNMTIGMMMAMQYIVGQINAPISQVISFVQSLQDASISMERLVEIHQMKDEDPDNDSRLRSIPMEADIVFQNVTYQYDGPRSPKVLDNISLRIPSGKITAIVGVSGSGKSTLLKMALGFYPPVTGSITLDGIPLSDYSPKAWRSSCGTVMQEGYIFSGSIESNIALSDDSPVQSRVREAAKLARIDEWVKSLPLGYRTRIGEDGHGLSVGQKQRILIARAIYKNSKYLFFDEATNSLDATNEKEIMENLHTLFNGRTVVIVAHRLSTVKDADNIVVLDNGRIVEEGRHKELVALHGYYYGLVKNQLELGN